MTTYFHLAGTLSVEVGGEEVPIKEESEVTPIVNHILRALSVYEYDGFRFVDVDADAILSDGFVSINWSDLDCPMSDPVELPEGRMEAQPDVLAILRDYRMHEPDCPRRQSEKAQANTEMYIIPRHCDCWLVDG